MTEQNGISRREFSVAAALAALSGVAITVAACGGGGGGESPTASSGAPGYNDGSTTSGSASADKTGTISSNHGHSAVVTAARITEAKTYSLDITGSSSHPHTVEITAADLVAIAGGQKVSKESSTDNSHSHTVTFN